MYSSRSFFQIVFWILNLVLVKKLNTMVVLTTCIQYKLCEVDTDVPLGNRTRLNLRNEAVITDYVIFDIE